MRDDFSNGPDMQMTGDFSNGPDRTGKREMSIKTPGPRVQKKSKTKNIARQSGPTNLLLIIIITESVSQSSSSLLFS